MTAATGSDVLWAVGTYEDEHGRRAPWRISHAEIGRDIGTATARLGELGVAGRRVLWCSMLSQAGQFWPYVCGTVMAGARLSCADATYGEAMRVSMFLRLMDYDAVFGVTEELLDGLEALERAPAEVFAGARLLGAHPGAYERLIALGLEPVRFAVCGPAVAIAREPGGPAFVPEAEWELTEAGGHIAISSRTARAQAFVRTPTSVRGSVVDGGIRPDPVPARPSASHIDK